MFIFVFLQDNMGLRAIAKIGCYKAVLYMRGRWIHSSRFFPLWHRMVQWCDGLERGG